MFLPSEYNHICALLLETCETPAGRRIDVKSVPPAVGKRIIFPLCAPSFPTSCYNTWLQQMEQPSHVFTTSSAAGCLMQDDLTRWIRLKYPLHTSSLSNMGLMIPLMIDFIYLHYLPLNRTLTWTYLVFTDECLVNICRIKIKFGTSVHIPFKTN